MLALAADLLQAEDVSVQPDELRPQHRNSLLQARPAVMPVVQVHEVEGGDAQLGGHSWWEVGEALNLFLLAGIVCSGEVWNASRRPIGLFSVPLQVWLSSVLLAQNYYYAFSCIAPMPLAPAQGRGRPP